MSFPLAVDSGWIAGFGKTGPKSRGMKQQCCRTQFRCFLHGQKRQFSTPHRLGWVLRHQCNQHASTEHRPACGLNPAFPKNTRPQAKLSRSSCPSLTRAYCALPDIVRSANEGLVNNPHTASKSDGTYKPSQLDCQSINSSQHAKTFLATWRWSIGPKRSIFHP